MPIIACQGFARDPERNLNFYQSRIERLQDDELYFELDVRRQGVAIGGAGFRGTIERTARGVERWVFGLKEDDIAFALRERERIAPDLADAPFLIYIANAIVSCYADDRFVRVPTEFVATVSEAALVASKIDLNVDSSVADIDFVLARRFNAGTPLT
jgi:hypothetical protein